ncbi:MAG: translation initiation factor IF-2 [Phycisphaerae bacterium]|nr:translation initiation factor IF-2 [Phycisphaerae bacterium]
MAKQMRVHILAKEIGVTSKAILDKCRAEGLELKNHMATLSAGLEATVREWFSEGAHTTAEEKSARVDLKKIRKKTTRKVTKTAAPKKGDGGEEQAPAATAVAEAPGAEAAPAVGEAPAEEPAAEGAEPAVAAEVSAAEVATGATVQEEPPVGVPSAEISPEAAEAPALEIPGAALPPSEPIEFDTGEGVFEVAARAPEGEEPPAPAAEAEPQEEPVLPAGPQLTSPAPAQLQGPQVIRMEAPEPERRFRPRPSGARPGGPRPGGPARPGGPPRPGVPRRGAPGAPPEPAPVSERGTRTRGRGKEPTEEEKKAKAGKHRYHPRRSKESIEAEERIREYRDRDLLEREERIKAAGERGGLRRRAADTASRAKPLGPTRKDRVEVSEPISMKELCSAMGIGFSRVFPKLMAMGKMAKITDTIDTETARQIAAEFEIELSVIESRTLLEELKDEYAASQVEGAKARPPVVTFLGHVDHGKTSLLDAVRKSRLLDREAGGITQQIGAYRYHEGDIDVTFIDTPGHEAFTAMRSRGATMTDVVVLVVAADDGVMPTTREAIQHARAANVPVVVALNKIDLPGIDLNRIYGQLAEENLAPAEWGGEVDVIKTSAVTGEGLGALLEHLTTLTDLLELRGDPEAPVTGWVVEAEEKRGEGIVATVLIREGTLKAGDIIVCGPAHGRVRSMRDDLGKPVEAATPGTPVEVSGLDVVPVSGERFYEVTDLRRAKSIAEQQQDQMRSQSLAEVSKPRSLEELFKERESGEVPELNVILRSDTHGKLQTLKAELSRIPDEQVKLRIILDGIGAITESDVMLASTSDAIIIGFWVVAEESARRMAQDLGVDVRMYRVIYEVTDEIRRALEGLLEPDKKEEHRGKLEVRQVFAIGRLGKVAGCYVTDGIISRNNRVRLIRDGAVVRENCAIGSLRRVKDDVREVRAGLECGLRIEGFDDIHAGDVVEVYDVIEVARTLS